VKCAQLFLSVARNRTIKAVHENVLANVVGQLRHRTNRAGPHDVVGSLVYARGTMHQDIPEVNGEAGLVQIPKKGRAAS
jgi:hypothetical protein